ncbi:hypothetical protein Ctu_3p00100 (plasmid) [Cronobacter turicensis z3032]|uniref:Uncharacterized protein n=1 Tax=Cronobacter turicensis (strain DSM 18703 / CCUG 55852 / LMG 23827 / z3032) TaxID=693216 RepID=C9Y5S0_CROTZ|nr:hypothetical protein Ctu_3p00100 [Cronobacter turicensis z3032]
MASIFLSALYKPLPAEPADGLHRPICRKKGCQPELTAPYKGARGNAIQHLL